MSILFRLLTRIGALLRPDRTGTGTDGGRGGTDHANGGDNVYLRSEHFFGLDGETDEHETVDE